MSHTPGPWQVRAYGNLKSGSVYADSHQIASVYTTKNKESEREANAKLIAAAPDLLEFAQWCLDMDPNSEAPLFVKARTAIAKAIGDK